MTDLAAIAAYRAVLGQDIAIVTAGACRISRCVPVLDLCVVVAGMVVR